MYSICIYEKFEGKNILVPEINKGCGKKYWFKSSNKYWMIFHFLTVRITTLQEEVKNLKNNLERVEAERKQAQDLLNHSEKVW